jgi:hypothetical protein
MMMMMMLNTCTTWGWVGQASLQEASSSAIPVGHLKGLRRQLHSLYGRFGEKEWSLPLQKMKRWFPGVKNFAHKLGYASRHLELVLLTLILLTWTIWRAPTNASKWRMGFNSAFKGLIYSEIQFLLFRFTRQSTFFAVLYVTDWDIIFPQKSGQILNSTVS